jgi:hypothetical protein
MTRIIALFLTLLPCLALADKEKDKSNIIVGARANGLSLEGAQGAVGVGLAVRAKVTPKWSVEGAADIVQNQVVQTAVPISVSAVRYLLPDSRFSLYGVAGVGLSFLRDDGSVTGEIDHSRLFGSAGFGGELQLNKTVIAADIRYLVMDKAVGQSAADSFVFDTSEAGIISIMVGRAF